MSLEIVSIDVFRDGEPYYSDSEGSPGRRDTMHVEYVDRVLEVDHLRPVRARRTFEDLWLEPDQVNLPGTRSSERPNWQRPMAHLLDDVFDDRDVTRRLRILDGARPR